MGVVIFCQTNSVVAEIDLATRIELGRSSDRAYRPEQEAGVKITQSRRLVRKATCRNSAVRAEFHQCA